MLAFYFHKKNAKFAYLLLRNGRQNPVLEEDQNSAIRVVRPACNKPINFSRDLTDRQPFFTVVVVQETDNTYSLCMCQ
jgi:hypothetical protein